ncbi:MAG: Gldg family protein [Xenococcaceae cyanobacterium MO_188.B29]|nr:Gldg family protein [Xenococcaceae cyanobacterium MO_188.B29]
MNKILFFLGLAITTAGIIIRLIENTWSSIAWGLLLAGLFILILCFILVNQNQNSFLNKRSVEAGTNTILSTCALLIILGLINFLAVRYSVRLDLTENKLFTLSPQTQTIVQNLSKPLKVLVFDPQSKPAIEPLLENYQSYNDNFRYEFVDPDLRIELREKFDVQSKGDIYLEYEDKKQLVQTINDNFSNSLSEVQLTNAIERIVRDYTPLVYFTQGHGEAELEEGTENSLSIAVKNLSDKGYKVEPINLATSGKIPNEPDVIVIPGPIRELFPQEVKMLQNYLNNGGSLLLMLIPNTNPELTPLLQDYGIKLDDRFIIDASGAGSILGFGPAAPLITTYGDHPITDRLGNGISIFPESRPITTTPIEGVTAAPLIITDTETWAEKNITTAEIAFNEQEDIKGPLNIGFAFSKSKPVSTDNQSSESRLVIFGSSTFIVNGWFEQQLNGDIFLNAVNWLAKEDEQTLSIRPKEPKNRRINLSNLQAGIISWTALRIMPMLGLVVAGAVWWRRR